MRRSDDLGRLPGPRVLAADQHIGATSPLTDQAISEAFGLLTTQFGESGTRPRTTDHPGHRGLRFSMADEHETGHRERAYFSFACERLFGVWIS